MDESLKSDWFDLLFKAEAMRRVFSDCNRLQRMLDFEAALTRAVVAAELIPSAAAAAIVRKCRAELFDISGLAQATANAGNTAIPVINELERLVAAESEEAARYVHFGATSQDAMDTGLVLQSREALKLIEDAIVNLCADLAHLAEQSKEVPLVGRTWIQQAAPTTLGLKVAGWLSALSRHRERIEQTCSRCLVLQLGGPVGTLAAYGNRAEKVAALTAKELQLALPSLPWHAHRDRVAEVAATLGLLVGTLGKMARDISLMAQTEIGELAEPAAPGRGGSSSMPQKQNPIGCSVVLAAATRVPALVSVMLAAMPQEHERGLGGWQAEWETLPEIFQLTAGALAHMRHIIAGLVVVAARMRANLEATGDLIYAESVSAALARRIGRAAAHAVVERACRQAIEQRRSLQQVIADDAEIASHLSTDERQRLFDPQQHIAAAARLVDRAIAASSSTISSSRPD
jgi:3-carboxy-cis,cis-muconate cycloisomerase